MKDDAAFAALKKPEFGLLVDDLYDPSPATKAGVRRGDFVTEINGTKIISVVDFQQSLYYFSGSQVPAKFFRDGKDVTVMLKIEERPAAANRN
jgi:S1-C subfamily serine protease